ncbi:hypothetical protein J2S57_005697 [Kineosporia succinea]|uniref:DUF1062 domain-containing protein n=2 Tax=Kineosporia succinea TaxID=84632 RepID=A0ABT9PB71_9ACTN|nr:DUF1062 domain-containing protein [Kineosporia succinea]MDP9829948.1 hypothetical protein [Kineosporia succinea]
MPTRLPLVVRRCHVCGGERFTASGKFRVNAHHKVLDAWMLLLCTRCDDTVKLTVLERVSVRYVGAQLLDGLYENSPALIGALLLDPAVHNRNRIALDWEGAWDLEQSGARPQDLVRALRDEQALEVAVHFGAVIPVRVVNLIAQGFGLSRGEVKRLVTGGNLVSAVRLGGRIASDFTFTLKP